MENQKSKTLADLPKFAVTLVRHDPMPDAEYQWLEFEGSYDPILETTFDQIIGGSIPQWFWLLFGERGYLSPMLKSFDKQTRTAILTCEAKEVPNVRGLELSYLSPYWQAFDVWMVLDPSWGWEKRQFQGVDAVAEEYEADSVSTVDGREIKVWTKLEPTGQNRGQSRYYPATDQTLPIRSSSRLVPGAWGHEHCELCKEHIDAEMWGYCDPDERWLCMNCYDRYVERRDLAFIDEL